jgi:hypothetical protein
LLVVTDQKFTIDYGNKITVTTTVDTSVGSAEIQAVRALFRPHGGSTIWSYSYPNYSPVSGDNGHISVTFEILTGPGSYYPPGTEFDIEIEITDTNGNRSSVISPESIEYLDPANEWERAQGDGYTVVYYGVDRSRVEGLIATIDHRIPTLQATLGVTETPDFKAVVFPSLQDATPSFPPVSQTATDQFLFAGFAQPQYRLFVQGQMNSTTFTHELAHLYTHEAISSSFLGGIPAWLNEGLARFLESGSSESSNDRLRSSVRPDELLSLNHMQTIPGQRSDVFIFYPQAGAFVGYLVEEYSHATMADFLAELNKGRNVQDAFELIYDRPLYEVENDWRALFGADSLPVPSTTPLPAESDTDKVADTPVPLVDYKAAARASSGQQPSSTTTPEFLPTVTPEHPPALDPAISDDEPSPNYVVAGIVIGLSVLVGVWLFTSRRRIPKRKTYSTAPNVPSPGSGELEGETATRAPDHPKTPES